MALDMEAALRAIAHPSRRRVLELVSNCERGASELADACGWTRPAASQHLRLLLDAELIEVHQVGNRRNYRAREAELAQLRSFLDQFWTARLATLDTAIGAGRGTGTGTGTRAGTGAAALPGPATGTGAAALPGPATGTGRGTPGAGEPAG